MFVKKKDGSGDVPPRGRELETSQELGPYEKIDGGRGIRENWACWG
jgi:hypothetical protein